MDQLFGLQHRGTVPMSFREKWKVFETLWNRNNMRADYTRAMNQRQSLSFQDKLKRLFSTDNEDNTGMT